ncbi:MAG TPA: hypothetical protein VF931_04685 [Steroidobacteraceae bacterium]
MAAAALTLATGAAVATSNFLLTIDNPKGADAARAGKGAIEVQTFSWGASNPGAVGGAGASAGKVNMPAVSRTAVKEPRDRASGHRPGRPGAPLVGETRSVTLGVHESPALAASPVMSACASGKHLGSVTLTGRSGAIMLEDVMVTSCAAEAGMRKLELTGHVTLIK